MAAVSVAHAECGVTETWLEELELAVLEARFEDARSALAELDARLECGEPVEPAQLARLWVSEGVLGHLTGDEATSADAFRAAARVSDDPWRAVFGPQLEVALRDAVAEPVGGVGEIAVAGATGFTTWYDGHPAELPMGAPVGLHTVQVVDRREVVWGRVLFLSPEQRLVLEPTGLPEPTPAPVPEPQPTRSGGRSVALLVAGSASLAAGVGAAGLALAETPRMQAADSREALDAAWTRQRVFGASAYALLGLGVVGVTLHVVR